MKRELLVGKLKEAQAIIEICLAELSGGESARISSNSATQNVPEEKDVALLDIVNKIKNVDNSEIIDRNILDQPAMAGRILLPFYICYEYFPDQSLTSGDIAKITSELRVGIKTPNISNALSKELGKYLEADATRKKGRVIRYRLNRKGANFFESLLSDGEKQ